MNGNAAQYTDSPLHHQRRAKQVRGAPTKGATGQSTRLQPSSSAKHELVRTLLFLPSWTSR